MKTTQMPYHKFLILDGNLTDSFVNFIDQSLIKQNFMTFRYGNTIPIGEDFHILVETNDVSLVNPSLISRCGILSLDNLQLSPMDVANNLKVSLRYPDIPLGIIMEKLSYNGFESQMIKKTISETLPKIIEIASKFKSTLSLSDNIGKIANDSISYGLQMMKINQINVSNATDIRTSFVISALTILLAYFDTNEYNQLEKVVQIEFALPLPNDWTGLQIPDELWDYYPHPTISLMRYYKAKIIPINFETLIKPPFKKVSQNFYFPDDYIVSTAQNIRQYNMLKVLVESNTPIILSGPISSGKTSLIRLVLKDTHQIDPIFVNVSKFTTTQDILTYFIKMTNLVSKHKKLESNTKYPICLVFENIEGENVEIMELIRMMMENKEILEYSKIGHKYFPKLHLATFNYIIITRDFTKFSPRFLSNFALVRIDQPTTLTQRIILKKQLLNAGVNSNLALFTSRIMQNLNMSIQKMQQLIIPLCNIPERSGKTNQTKAEYCKMLFSEIFIEYYYCQEEQFSDMFSKAEILFDEYDLARAYQQLQIDPTHYAYTIDQNKMDVKPFDTITIDLLIKEKLKIETSERSAYNFAMLQHSLHKQQKPIIIKADECTELTQFIGMQLPIKTQLVDFIQDKTRVRERLKDVCNRSVFNEQLHFVIASIHKNEQDIYDLLTSILIYHDFPIIFNEKEIERMCQKMANEENLTIDLRAKSIAEIKADLAKNTRLIIITNEIYDFMNDYHYDFIITYPPTLKMISNQYLSGQYRQISNIIATIIESITDIIPFNNSLLEKELVKIFSSRVEKENESNERQIQRIQKCNDFLDLINQIYEKSTDVIDDLKSQKEMFEKQLADMKKQIAESNETISMKKGQLGETMKKKNLKVLEQKDLLEEAEFNKKVFKPQLEMNKEDLPKLREACISADPKVRVIIETVFAILGTRAIEDDFIERMNNLDYESINLLDFQLFSIKVKEDPIMDRNMIGPLQALFKFLQNAMKTTESSVKKTEIQQTLKSRERSVEIFNIAAAKEQANLKDEQLGVNITSDMVQSVTNGVQYIKKQITKEEEKRRVIEQITKDISILKMKWDDKLEILQKRETTIPADEMLYSFYLIYCGMVETRSSRGDILDAVMDAMIAKNYETSYQQQLDAIEDKLLYPPGVDMKLFIPPLLKVDISHILLSPVTPLIIDPDHIATDIIINSKPSVAVSVYEADFDQKVAQAKSENKTLIVTEVSKLDSRIEKVLMLKIFVILVSIHRKASEIPEKLTKETIVIDCSESTLDAVRSNVSKVILSKFDSDLVPKLVHNGIAEKTLNDDIERFMEQLIDTMVFFHEKISQPTKYDLAGDKEQLTKLFAAKDYLIQTLCNTPNFGLIQKEYSQAQQQFGSVIEAAEKLWIALSRKVSLLNHSYCFSFDQYLKLLDSTLEKSVSAAKSIHEARKKVIHSVIAWVSNSLCCPDLYFFLFASSFMLKHGNWNDFDAIAEHINEVIHDKMGFLQVDLTPSHAIENLKYGPIEAIFKLIDSYVSEVIGPDYPQYIINYSTDHLLNSMNKLPTIVFISKNKYDVINSAVDYALARGMSDTFAFISLNEITLEKCQTFFDQISQTARTLFISYSSYSHEITVFVYRCIMMHLEGKCHAQFKPIFIVSDTIRLPPIILSKVRKIVYEDFPSPRFMVFNIIERLHTLFDGIEESRNIRRILFIICIIFAQIDILNFTRPFEIVESPCNAGDVKPVFQSIYHLFSTNDIPMKNIRDLFDEVIFSSKSENEFLRQRISNLIFIMLSNECFDDTYQFVDPAARDALFWTIPKDATINQMLQNTISKYPVLPSITITGMKTDRTSLILATRLSIYVSRPFIKYFNTMKKEENSIKSVDQFLTMIPQEIEIEKIQISSEIIRNFWITESNKFNSIIKLIKNTAKSYEHDILLETTPEKWQFNRFNSRLKFFIRQLCDIKKQIENGVSYNFDIIDASLVLDMQNYFLTLLSEAATNRRQTLDSLEILFSLQDNIPGMKFIDNLYMMNGNIQESELVNSDAVITKLPRISIRIASKDDFNGRTFKIPIFESFGGKIVYKALLPSQRAEREIITNNVSIYCNVDENMK